MATDREERPVLTTESAEMPPSTDDVALSDLARVDAHVITAEEYEELPELTDEMMDRADFRVGGRLVRRGRPPKPDAKEAVSLRLSPEVLAHFRAGGPGWQTRIDAVLRDAVAQEKDEPRG